VTRAETETGLVRMELRNGLSSEFPRLRGRQMTAYTARENDFVYSAIAEKQGDPQ